MKFSSTIEELLKRQSLANVATADSSGRPNVSLKGIVDFDIQNGILYFFDLFCKNTRKNLQENDQVAISLVDVTNFAGFQFKGKAEMIDNGAEFDKYIYNWHLSKHNRFKERINWSVSKFIKSKVSEIDLPKPKYLIKVTVEKIINLAAFVKE